MRMIKYMAVLSVLISALVTACEDEFSPNLPQGRIEEVSFAKDTFVFSEAADKAQIQIVAAKYLNYASEITVKVVEETAIEKENFYIDEKEVKMKLGEALVNVDMRIVDDTVINPNRSFKLVIENIKGGGKPAATRQSCVVVLRNDDYIPEAAVVLDNLTEVVREDAGMLTIPFHVTKPVPGAVTVTFAQGRDDRQTAQEGVHFRFPDNVKSVTLPEGVLKGEIQLEIIDNQTADGDVDFDFVIRETSGVLVGLDSLCKVTIQDEDLDRSVRFGGPENDTQWHEEAGTIEIPLIFEGGASAEKMISGKLAVDSLFGCTAADFKLETTEFTTAGDAILKVKVSLKDNEAFGEWGFRLNFRELANVRAVTKNYVVMVKDDERILGFKQAAYEVEEGQNVSIEAMLQGGDARERTPLTIQVLEEGTTADPKQYSFPTNINPIYAGTPGSTINLTTYKHSSRNDRKLKIKVSTTIGATSPGKILTDESNVCEVVIKNTDGFFAFPSNEFAGIYKGTYSIPVASSGFDENAVIEVKVKSSTMNPEDYELIEDKATIPAGQKSGSVKLKVNKAMTPDDRIVLEIARVTLGAVEDNSQIDPDRSTCACKVPNVEGIGTKRVDRTGWTISSFSTEEANGEGATGRAKDILDGKLETFWHSEWQQASATPPFTIVVDMQNTIAASGGDIIRRGNATGTDDGNPDTKKVFMEMSNDQTTWTPIGTIDKFDKRNGSVRTTEVVFGRYLRLTINEGSTGVASIAEVYLTGENWKEK